MSFSLVTLLVGSWENETNVEYSTKLKVRIKILRTQLLAVTSINCTTRTARDSIFSSRRLRSSDI